MKYEMMDAKKIIGETTAEEADLNPNICVVSTDSAPRTGMGKFIEKYPNRYYEVGIMEQAAIGVSAGLAVTGKVPVFCAPAPFVTARPFEMFKIDVGYMHQNVKVIGRNCGFNYSDLGPTHYGLEDIALVRLIPDVVILAPIDASQLRGAMKAMLRYEGPVYLRIGTAPIPKIFNDDEFEIGKGIVVREGKDVAIITTGEISVNVFEAADKLAAAGIDAMVIAMPTIAPIDEEIIVKAAELTGKIVTVEEHFEVGGLGSAVSEVCAKSFQVPVKRIGVPQTYLSSGPYEDLVDYCKLSVEGITETVLEFVAK
jgi:transketolase